MDKKMNHEETELATPLLDWPNSQSVYTEVLRAVQGKADQEEGWWDSPPVTREQARKLAPSLEQKLLELTRHYDLPQGLLEQLNQEQTELAREIALAIPEEERARLAQAMSAGDE